MTVKTPVLVIVHSLPFYHVPCWSLLGSHPQIDLTVAHGVGYITGPKGVQEGEYDESMPFRAVKGMAAKSVFGRPVYWHSTSIDLLKREHFDVVIHQFELKILSMWKTRHLVRKKGGKFVLWGIGRSLQATPVLDVARRAMVNRADAMVFYAEENRDRYVGMGLDPHRLFVAPNSIDLQPIDDALADWPTQKVDAFKSEQGLSSGPVLLHVGRLLPRKRLDLLIEATALLKRKYPKIVVLVIGDGPEEEKLRQMARSRSLDDQFKFLGMISGEERLAPWFLASDLIVAPAQVGHLATHAHAYGRPLVTCDNTMLQGPEVKILIADRTGVLYHHEDVPNLVNTIEDLLDNPERRRRMGIEARERAHEFCGIPRMVNGFLEVISFVTGTSLAKFE